jgi:hypothetical protein
VTPPNADQKLIDVESWGCPTMWVLYIETGCFWTYLCEKVLLYLFTFLCAKKGII